MFPDVQEIFGRIDTLNRAVDERRGGHTGQLAIAASPTFINAYLPKGVARLRLHSPGACVTIHTMPTEAIEERVTRREVDIGLVYAPIMDPSVVIEKVSNSSVVCAASRQSPLSTRRKLGPEASATIVATGPTTRIGMAIKEAYRTHRLPMPPYV